MYHAVAVLFFPFQLKLCLADSRNKTSSLKAVLLIITAGLMLHLNWRLQHLSLGECTTN